MNLSEYQSLARRTSSFASVSMGTLQDQRENMLMAVLGLSGESGEIADLVKKQVYHLHPQDLAALSEEIGDTLWYIAELCSALRLNLDMIAEANIAKLKKRYGTTFSSEKSINRAQANTGP